METDKKGLSKEQEKNKNISVQLLDSYRGALEKVRDYFNSIQDLDFTADNIDQNMKIIKSILDAGSSLGKNMESLSVLEKRVQTEEQVNSKVRGNAKLSLLEEDTI
jgi:hypothetical protein